MLLDDLSACLSLLSLAFSACDFRPIRAESKQLLEAMIISIRQAQSFCMNKLCLEALKANSDLLFTECKANHSRLQALDIKINPCDR